MMRTSLAFLVFTLLLAMGAIAHLGIGARFIAPRTVVDAFFHFDPRNFDHNVIIRLRLLRLCAAMVTGAALGVAGVLLQSVIRNPLGEPHILGLNAGAALSPARWGCRCRLVARSLPPLAPRRCFCWC